MEEGHSTLTIKALFISPLSAEAVASPIPMALPKKPFCMTLIL